MAACPLQLGLKAGAQLVAMSDPFRPGEMSRLGDRASLRFVRDSIRLTASPTVTLEFVQLPPESVEATAPGKAACQVVPLHAL